MSKLMSLLKAAALLAIILIAIAAVGASTSQQGPASKTFLQPDLSLKTVLTIPVAQPAVSAPLVATGLRTCRCSCGQPCKTDADCGGSVCAPGITCCNATPRNEKDSLSLIFQQREELSSRSTPSLIKINVNCNQK